MKETVFLFFIVFLCLADLALLGIFPIDLRKINIRNAVKKLQWRKQMPSSNAVELQVTPNQKKSLKNILTSYIEENSDVSELSASEIHAVAHAKKILEKLG